ncbi:PPIC-type PPIASE domain protein [Bacteriovorax sp. BAL6_X]|uniref:peptidylprolyl isomerase n=1 Tax=Bacteriovorax sp. BAL6_X TaxID=1201290 RepID=UPI00038671AC|nr:SurA N-terminal domain-containing protein [Bacteriovorax sp. BAL6_X]EPZ49919.1 PPIC-type PPIASE domain protein [Bacteriovorax sp. BAL6_X]
MSSNFQKKSSQIFLTLFIGIIVVSFMVSGPFFNTGTPDSIGSVAGHDIKVRDFNMEVQRQSDFYSKFIGGGQPLTSQQMSQYKVYDNAIRNLVFQKLRVVLAEDLGILVSKDEVVNDIKNTSYFQTNKQFDINKYKTLLSYNKFTPENYEEETKERIAQQKLQNIVQHVPVSKALTEELNKLYNEKRNAKIITIKNANVRKLVTISSSDITEFLKEEANKAKVESLFKDKLPLLSQQEEVKTRHILLTFENGNEADALKEANKIRKEVNKKNFVALAKKYTQEPQGKTNGGDLNWVKRGQMVPEFEKAAFTLKKGEISQPVKTSYGYHIIYAEDRKEAVTAKLADHQRDIAKEILQKEKDVTPLMKKAITEVQKAASNSKALKSLEKKYGLGIKEININKLEGAGPTGELDEKQVAEVFTKDSGLFTFEDATQTTIVATTPAKSTDSKGYDVNALTNISAQQTLKTLLDKLGKEYTFKQNKYAQLPQ